MEQIKEYIYPELMILVPVLYIIGVVLKRSKKVKDEIIPTVLTILGIVMAFLYAVGNLGLTWNSVFVAICQGVICTGTAVYANQMYKQAKENGDE